MYETIHKPERSIFLFAVEYAAMHRMENESPETEPIMASILDKVEYAHFFRDLWSNLTEKEKERLKKVLCEELDWCKETLIEELSENVREEVSLLDRAYEKTINVIEGMVN